MRLRGLGAALALVGLAFADPGPRRGRTLAAGAASLAPPEVGAVELRVLTAAVLEVSALCHFRYFGHCFNPASFYFCYDTQGVRVETILIEVHNTPWGEVFLYVLDESLNSGKDNWKQYSFDKKFHVSPLMGMDMHYDWRFREPGSELNIHINSYHNGEKYFDATLTLKRQEISSRSLNRMLVEYPFVTVKVIAMIYWQALRLLGKRVPFYPHPPKQRGRAES